MKPILKIMLLLPVILITLGSNAQIPLSYDVENRGAECPAPPLPEIADLPVIEPLTDPFEWSDGSGRSTSLEDWICRRAEIKAEIEHYEIGPKPDRPEDITATYVDGVLTVNITVNDSTLTLTSSISLPEGNGPFPAIIGMGGPSGSLPPDIFDSRSILRIPFNFGQVMAWEQVRGSEPINRLYPDLAYMGAYAAWSWGVSRLIDGLELVEADLPIDLTRLAVSGCSFAGKMALFAGAFDERIALTIAQESGGGGAAAWRVSETLGPVETLGSTSHVWFMNSMFQFAGAAVSKLPMDHHELVAMIAPRAVLCLGNPDFVWLADESGYVSCRAAEEVWKTFGIPERFGYSIIGGHSHCALHSLQRTAVEAFVDRFMLDNTEVSTDISYSPYEFVDASKWYEWWGTGVPEFPVRDPGDNQVDYYEPECAGIGENWRIVNNPAASNGQHVTIKNEFESVSAASADAASHITITFNAEKDTTYFVFGRCYGPTANDDSFWLKMDDGAFSAIDGLQTNGWEWKYISHYDLSAGEHTLTIAARENGAGLDKICFSSFVYPPSELGNDALNSCTSGVENQLSQGYKLEQNFPNPSGMKTSIAFELPHETHVSLKVYSVLGQEIAELAGREYMPGRHTVDFDQGKMSKGVYFYTLKADGFTASKRMVIQ